MENAQNQEPQTMSGNIQGFELPRGCLMTSGLILTPIVTMVVGLIVLDHPYQTLFALMLLPLWITITKSKQP
ncbi:hypothetical protein [Yoonia sp.]|uniref:hypothetical protein n=1 Tax=Yoonia sp. TaxID=2212373 RepID=UPI0035902B57